MTYRWFLLVMALATVGAWTVWIFVIHSIDPVHTALLGFFLFYLSLFVALLGTAVLLGTLVRLWARPTEIAHRQTTRAFRQGILLSGLFLGALVLLSFELLRWWSAFLLILFFALIELLFVTQKRPQ
ncbi:MAG: hypothetical protein AAB431_00685 [Patescibacteria group bacterium]